MRLKPRTAETQREKREREGESGLSRFFFFRLHIKHLLQENKNKKLFSPFFLSVFIINKLVFDQVLLVWGDRGETEGGGGGVWATAVVEQQRL